MTTAQTTLPELMFAPRAAAGPEVARPSWSARLHALRTRFGDYFQNYDDYFAEVERSLPPHVREQRRQRQQANQVFLIAALSR